MDPQEVFLGPWSAWTLASGLYIGILNRKSELQSLGWPGSQKCLLGHDNILSKRNAKSYAIQKHITSRVSGSAFHRRCRNGSPMPTH